jgi:catechol 2,3-dioxygenase-like lactoylglutathione lyase family enzyme
MRLILFPTAPPPDGRRPRDAFALHGPSTIGPLPFLRGATMLKEMHAVLPASDLARARKWYHDMLGMDPAEEHMEARLITYRVDGSAFDIYETDNAGTAKNTQLCFETEDLSEEMRVMRERGVMFEEFEIPGVMKTENGVVAGQEGMTTWFRDSEGNFLCMTQRLMAGAMGSQMGSDAGRM